MDKLLNEKEAAEYIGISQDKLKKLVQQKKLTAYKIGGQFLRFHQFDLDKIKKSPSYSYPAGKNEKYSLFNRIKDYLYYNDFYIIIAILIIILLALVFKASF